MQIGPFVIRRRTDPEPMPQAAHLAAEEPGRFEERGATGTIFLNGILTGDEYLQDLVGDKAVRAYDRMYRSDGQVRAVVKVCELPLMTATWTTNPASDDPQDVEIAQFVHDNLFSDGSQQPIGLAHALSCYRYGYAVAEPIWALGADRRIRLDRLAPRLARATYRWYPTPEGELDIYQQRVWVPAKRTEAPRMSASVGPNLISQGGTYEFRDIPAWKGAATPGLVRWTLDQEGSNFEGISLLRSAYKHWFMKETFYKIDAIGAERNALAIPVFEEPQGAQKSDRDFAAKVLMSLHAHEKSYVLAPYGWKFRLEAPNGRPRDIMPSIEHHDRMIARSVLAGFLNLDSGSGSWALSRDQSSFFLMALKAHAWLIAREYNRILVRALVDLNFQVDRYPMVVVADLDQRKVQEWLGQIAQLFTSGGLTADADTENFVRRELGLPDLPQEATEEGGGSPTVDADSQGETGEGGEAAKAQLAAKGAPRLFWRDLRPREQRTDLAAIDAGIEQAKRDFVAAVAPVQRQQIAELVRVAQTKFVDKGKHVDVDKIDVPNRADLTTAILEAMVDQYRNGQRQVQAEARKQESSASLAIDDDFDAEDLPPRILKFFQDKAKSTSGILVIQGKAEFARLMNRQTDDGRFDENEIMDTLTRVFERQARNVAPSLIHDALSAGRSDGAKKLGAEVAEYSAILDQNTCSPCAALDGREFAVGSSDYDRYMPPYSGCEGGDRCRCVYLYDFLK